MRRWKRSAALLMALVLCASLVLSACGGTGTAGTDLAALAAAESENVTQPRRAPAVSTRNIADVRKGFIWAKVLDEPRFKRRWSAQYR